MRKRQPLADIVDGVEIVENECQKAQRREEQGEQDRARSGCREGLDPMERIDTVMSF